jgi:hypothetical protein
MCRLILARGKFSTPAILQAAVSMSMGHTADHEGPWPYHPDGWGAIWRKRSMGGALALHRDTRPISHSVDTSPVQGITTDFLAIHVRHATLARNHGPQFTHPLERSDSALVWYFMHNGFMPTVYQLLGLDASYFDSAEYFNYIVPAGTPALNKQETLARLRAIPPGGTSGNAIAVNPQRAYVIHWSPPTTPYPRYVTMHRLVRPNLLVIASEIIQTLAPREQWEPLPEQFLEIPLTTGSSLTPGKITTAPADGRSTPRPRSARGRSLAQAFNPRTNKPIQPAVPARSRTRHAGSRQGFDSPAPGSDWGGRTGWRRRRRG